MSRQLRDALERELGEEIRGWQHDQDLFDEAMAMMAGLNRTDLRCLDIVSRDGPITAGALAAAVRLTTGAVTAVLDRLEHAGYVRRVRDTADRRKVLVEATSKVDQGAGLLLGPLIEEAGVVLRKYSDGELALCVDFLRTNRELLVRHTSRLHDLLAERDSASRPTRPGPS